MEKNARKIAASAEKLPNGKKLTENYGKLKALAESEEGKRLVASMNEADLSNLGKAGGGDAAEMLKRLLASPEGRELVKKVAGATGL